VQLEAQPAGGRGRAARLEREKQLPQRPKEPSVGQQGARAQRVQCRHAERLRLAERACALLRAKPRDGEREAHSELRLQR
tara:strand:- start:21 stop:260 length:240 start_codon:yes stop_codon:yes gene_type:complete